MKRSFLWPRLLIILCLLSACVPASAGLLPRPTSLFEGWKPADLRYLQAPDADPQHSLIAVYQRQTEVDLEIRLDLLDLARTVDFDLYLLLDTRPGGSTEMPLLGIQAGLAYDLLIKIPAGALPVALDENLLPMRKLTPRTANSPALGIVTIALQRAALPGNLNLLGLQIFLTEAGKTKILSQTQPIFPTQARPQPASLLLVFWNSLPAAAPSQALRRWEGAHTGPLGGRHGLSVLLRAADNRKIPLVLADLLQPAALAGLSSVGGLARLSPAAWSGDVLLPDAAYGDPQAWRASLTLARAAAAQAGLPSGGTAFGAFTPPLPENYTTFFADLTDRTRLVTWQGKRLVPLPEPVYRGAENQPEPQVSIAGLSLEVRQALLAAALAGDPSRLVVLGGSLPESAWGDLSAAPAAFDYIATHPWISVLRAADLQTLPAQPAAGSPLPGGCRDLLCTPALPEIVPVTGGGQPAPSGITLAGLRQALRAELEKLPAGAFTAPAWQSYLALTVPTAEPQLAGLQANALGQIGYLQQAARWDLAPGSSTDCSQDLDYDGLPECMLSSDRWLAVIKPEGGRLVFAAQRGAQGAAQWIGASSQFAVGLSDPSEWQPQLGPAGDPSAIPGAFAPAAGSGPYELYTPQILHPGQVTLRSADGATLKSYAIDGDSFHIILQSAAPQAVRIPITLSLAAQAFAPRLDGSQWLWQPPSGPGLRITVQGAEALTASSCLDTSADMAVQENPNRAYPPGHYLPYPLALLEFQGNQVSITLSAP